MTNGSVKTVLFSVLAMILSVEECTSGEHLNTCRLSCVYAEYVGAQVPDTYKIKGNLLIPFKCFQGCLH